MRHPTEASLALFAGGDLGRFARWKIARHLETCAGCRQDVADYAALRPAVAAATDLPEVSWDRLAAEMKANIRVGLEAGECVDRRAEPRLLFAPRAWAAYASLAGLLVASLWLQRPAPRVAERQQPDQIILEATGNGIQVKEGGLALGLMHNHARDVSYFASGGVMRARYVDADTGYVMINNVYSQ